MWTAFRDFEYSIRSSIWFCSLALLVFSACQKVDRGELVAEVGKRKLYTLDLKGVVPPGTAEADSLRLVQEYVQRWVREAAVFVAADAELDKDPEIDRLLEDYRASLLRHRFEEQMLAQNVDTIISYEELKALYDQVSSSTPAPYDLTRALVVELASDAPELESFESEWKKLDEQPTPFILDYAGRHAKVSFLDPQRWLVASELEALMPGSGGSLFTGTRVVEGGGRKVYVRVLETLRRGQPAPFGYLEASLRKMALEQRRTDYLLGLKEQLYQNAQRDKQIRLYISDVY